MNDAVPAFASCSSLAHSGSAHSRVASTFSCGESYGHQPGNMRRRNQEPNLVGHTLLCRTATPLAFYGGLQQRQCSQRGSGRTLAPKVELKNLMSSPRSSGVTTLPVKVWTLPGGAAGSLLISSLDMASSLQGTRYSPGWANRRSSDQSRFRNVIFMIRPARTDSDGVPQVAAAV